MSFLEKSAKKPTTKKTKAKKLEETDTETLEPKGKMADELDSIKQA